MEIWQHTGYPSDEEILQWKDLDGDLFDHLAIRHECPHCGSNSTRWIRNQWNVCFTCLIPFTTEQAMDYKSFLREEKYGITTEPDDSLWEM